MIYPFLTTIFDHTDGFEKQYYCEYAIYLLSCLSLECYIIVDREVGSPGHGKYVVDDMNDRNKHMLKLSKSKLLNP